jgi:hypothetical protein
MLNRPPDGRLDRRPGADHVIDHDWCHVLDVAHQIVGPTWIPVTRRLRTTATGSRSSGAYRLVERVASGTGHD